MKISGVFLFTNTAHGEREEQFESWFEAVTGTKTFGRGSTRIFLQRGLLVFGRDGESLSSDFHFARMVTLAGSLASVGLFECFFSQISLVYLRKPVVKAVRK